jgi:DNA-binding MarR family transcriptional regulator
MLVDRLENAGWVGRRKHPTDRRYLLIELTPRALEATPNGLAEYHATIRRLTAHVPAAHRTVIADLLRQAADAAAQAAGQQHT